MATLRELAERTGYSPATISRILTGDPALAVSEEARKRVLEEAGRLNYAATKSRRGRSPKHLLRVAVAEMLTPAQQLRDPFYLYLRGYVEQACLDQKYAFLPLTPRGEGFVSPEGMAVDGVVAIGRFTPAQAESLRSVSENVVFLNSSPDDARFDSVVLNYELGIRLALDHLLGLGHTRIGFIGPALEAGRSKGTSAGGPQDVVPLPDGGARPSGPGAPGGDAHGCAFRRRRAAELARRRRAASHSLSHRQRGDGHGGDPGAGGGGAVHSGRRLSGLF